MTRPTEQEPLMRGEGSNGTRPPGVEGAGNNAAEELARLHRFFSRLAGVVHVLGVASLLLAIEVLVLVQIGLALFTDDVEPEAYIWFAGGVVLCVWVLCAVVMEGIPEGASFSPNFGDQPQPAGSCTWYTWVAGRFCCQHWQSWQSARATSSCRVPSMRAWQLQPALAACAPC